MYMYICMYVCMYIYSTYTSQLSFLLVSNNRYYYMYAESNTIMVSPFICNKADKFLQIFSKSLTVAGGAFEEEKVIFCFVMPHLNGLRDNIVQVPR